MLDYEELVNLLKICPDYCNGCTNCPHEHDLGCRTTMMGEAADAIEELVSNAYKTKWISVEERLPEEAGEYIVAYHPCYWDSVNTKCTKVGIDNFRGKTTWAKKKFQRVTHWMPLPEPPKEDGNA